MCLMCFHAEIRKKKLGSWPCALIMLQSTIESKGRNVSVSALWI